MRVITQVEITSDSNLKWTDVSRRRAAGADGGESGQRGRAEKDREKKKDSDFLPFLHYVELNQVCFAKSLLLFLFFRIPVLQLKINSYQLSNIWQLMLIESNTRVGK